MCKQEFQVIYVAPERFLVSELQDTLVVLNQLPHTKEVHRSQAYVVTGPYKVFNAVH
jgi:hypothetical protein